MLVQDFLHRSAERQAKKIALVFEGQRLTYGEIEDMANRMANALLAYEVKRGDRVLINLGNSIETVVAIFATLKAGCTFVVIHPSTKPEKLLYILNNCQAAALVTGVQGAFTGEADKIRSQVPSLRLVIHCGEGSRGGASDVFLNEILYRFDNTRPPTTNIDRDLACLIYTSGSTGEPKGVMSDHSNVVFAAKSIIEYLQNVEQDVVINVLPLSFDYGLYQLLMVFKFGGTLVLENSFAFPHSILKLIQQERVTGLPGVPTLFALLSRMDLSPYDLSSLRYITNTAAALPPGHTAELRRKFPSVRLFSMYGLTETKRTLYLPPELLDKKPNSVGHAIPGTEVWLEDAEGQRIGANQVGELVVRGRHVMRGYWGDEKASAQRFPCGPIPGERLCRTGDLFRMDEDGHFYFVGRRDDIIKSRGEKVSPKEVEGVLYAMPDVLEAAVVGVPDPVLGEAIKAFIVARTPSLTVTQVFTHCRAHLESFMVPKYVEFQSQLPKTNSGKIKKPSPDDAGLSLPAL